MSKKRKRERVRWVRETSEKRGRQRQTVRYSYRGRKEVKGNEEKIEINRGNREIHERK